MGKETEKYNCTAGGTITIGTRVSGTPDLGFREVQVGYWRQGGDQLGSHPPSALGAAWEGAPGEPETLPLLLTELHTLAKPG